MLARSLFERDRYDAACRVFDDADETLERFGSAGHRATGWMARAELESRRGDDSAAADLDRRAAEALQDVHF